MRYVYDTYEEWRDEALHYEEVLREEAEYLRGFVEEHEKDTGGYFTSEMNLMAERADIARGIVGLMDKRYIFSIPQIELIYKAIDKELDDLYKVVEKVEEYQRARENK